MQEIYFDNAATTRTLPQSADVMVRMLTQDYGNPSSMHRKGFEAELAVRKARETIAKTMRAAEKEIFFTSGGTEGNNLALIGTALAWRRQRRHIIASGIEHASVYQTLRFLEKEGFEVTFLPVDDQGLVRVEDVKNAIREDTCLVSVMCVNNEVGAIEPIEEIGYAVKAEDSEIVFHTDCVQAYGKMPVTPGRWKADLVTVSSHKIHGPKGAGAIYIREGSRLRPILHGGNQERGIRSGTENVPGICAFADAASYMCDHMEEHESRIREVKEHFLTRAVHEIEDVLNHSGKAAHIASLSFPGIRSEVLLHALEDKGIYVSAGSACSSNKPEISRTLKGMGLDKRQYESTLRFSFSIFNTKEEADVAVEALKSLVPALRRFKRR